MLRMVSDYIGELLLQLATGSAREHSYRPALKSLFELIDPTIRALNEPSRSAYGAPDFAFYKSTNINLILGYVETKDINVNLDDVEKTEQLKRYLGYPNLILTNYLEFRFFRNGEKYQSISIAKPNGLVITPISENYLALERELRAFMDGQPESITNAKKLAQIMGGKASRLKDNVSRYIQSGDDASNELEKIYKAMRELLVHDLEYEKFADMYAQTLVYGLFVARYYDQTPDTFTREEARDLIPASNPFLRHFFDHIAGANFDKRLRYIVDELCQVFSVSDIKTIIQKHYNLFREVSDKDPIIHFYEDFLKEYDPDLRRKMGAYYTPIPVVQFMIRAVDEVLKEKFDLAGGIADITRVRQTVMQQGTPSKDSPHRVQLLDPAVGTATFLNEIIKFIHMKFETQGGAWESYVNDELLPRLYGFELMMAPYTIAHLKLAMTLKDSGIDRFERRLGVYLTNTLEEGIKDQQDMFTTFGLAGAITDESRAANVIKHERPIMVVIGNPPYSVSSANKGEWIQNLIKDYKKDLNEKKINLDDDYIKFIRFAENLVEKNGEGIVAMITNNSYLDGDTHRQMRRHLLETFNDIYILDLHGNTKKKETSPDGSKDVNVFDIQQGVSIAIFIRGRDKKNGLGNIYHSDLYGKRQFKFDELEKGTFGNLPWNKIKSESPSYYFLPKDFKSSVEYKKGFPLSKLFRVYTSGIETQKDSLAIQFHKVDMEKVVSDFNLLNSDDLRKKYSIKDSRDWTLNEAMRDVNENQMITDNILYRPFDFRFTRYSGKSKGFMSYPRSQVMNSLSLPGNIAIQLTSKNRQASLGYFFVSKIISDRHLLDTAGDSMQVFPLYLISQDGSKVSNLDASIIENIQSNLNSHVTPENLLDYIYAILYSPTYRKKYKEFLKIDFPWIPFPDERSFSEISSLGAKLRKLHLMEDQSLSNFVTTFKISGDNIIEEIQYKERCVWINETQYFGDIPSEAWEFYIGGYQPAQKWLKDRKGRKLTFEDINHYQKIIVILIETQKIMRELDVIISLQLK